MQRKDTRVFDKGPGAIGSPVRFADADEREADEVYVFASKPVDLGDGRQIPAFQLVRVRVDRRRVPSLQELARRKNGVLIACPPGWEPTNP